jgi:hypothetical protein
MGKKIVSSQLSLFLRREVFLCWDALKVQCVMLIKWENFGAFLSLRLGQKNILTGDILSKFHCISML